MRERNLEYTCSKCGLRSWRTTSAITQNRPTEVAVRDIKENIALAHETRMAQSDSDVLTSVLAVIRSGLATCHWFRSSSRRARPAGKLSCPLA
jgi:hypothetical protein